MIECQYRTTEGTCKHVDTACGKVVVGFTSKRSGRYVAFGEDACQSCIKEFPDESRRINSSAVASFLYHGCRAKLIGKDMPCGKAKVEYKRPNRCEHLGKIVNRMNCNCPKKHTYECNLLTAPTGGPLHVIPLNQCETCPHYIDEGE